MQAITVDHARNLLGGSASVLDTAYEVGLSGGSRLHDLFVSHEAMTPGDYKRRGEGLEMAYGFHASPFGDTLMIATERGWPDWRSSTRTRGRRGRRRSPT